MPPLMRRVFKLINRFFMVPMFRLGIAPFFGNPLTGYIMVMKVIRRKTGKTRFTPVNYAIHRGNVYCLSGGRRQSHWFHNLLAHPEVEIILPGGTIFACMEEVTSPAEKLMLTRQVLKSAGFAGFFEGFNPWRIGDEELAEKIADIPLLRFHPMGLGSGAGDAGGWAWVWSFAITILIIFFLVR